MLSKLIIAGEETVERRSALWNMAASILGSAQSAVFLLVVTNICDEIYAGIFSLATTLGYQIITIGNYGMRNYQATDVKQKYSFQEYFISRCITSVCMLLFVIVYLWVKGYGKEKALIIFFFCIFKGIDVIEDVFHGEFQRYNRLDIGAISMTIRYVISFIVFFGVLLWNKNLLFSCICETVISLIIFVWLTYEVVKPKKVLNVKGTSMKKVFFLLKDCFPLFLGGFLYLYICNAPKYAIDSCLAQEKQAYFAILFMPVFVINLLSGFIYRPLLTRMAIYWADAKQKEFKSIIVRQFKFILFVTIAGMIGAYLVGTEFLTLIYSISVIKYKWCLVILISGGGLAAIIGFLVNVLTIMRLHQVMLCGYILVAAIGICISNVMVVRYGLMGASVLYIVLMLLLTVFLLISFCGKIYRSR